MKYLKLFTESNKNQPQLGDYVYCEVTEEDYTPSKFVGKLIEIRFKEATAKTYPYKVKYKSERRLVKADEIIAFAKTKDELEFYINVNKYNL